MSESTFPNIPVAVIFSATLDDYGNVTSHEFSFTPQTILLPYNGPNPADQYSVVWDLVAQDQNGDDIPGVNFGAHGVHPEYPSTWGQPQPTPGRATEYTLAVSNQNTSGEPETYGYTATVSYRGTSYPSSDPEITFEPMPPGKA